MCFFNVYLTNFANLLKFFVKLSIYKKFENKHHGFNLIITRTLITPNFNGNPLNPSNGKDNMTKTFFVNLHILQNIDLIIDFALASTLYNIIFPFNL